MIHAISLADLEFRRIPVEFWSSCGVPQTRWIRTGMPRIPQNVINSTFYLYRTMKQAKDGTNPAGSGFIVRHDGRPGSLNYSHKGSQHFAVTNWHVACQEGASIIRLNTATGGTDVVELGPEDWHFLPGKYDVAATPLTLDDKIHSASAISTRSFYWPMPERGLDGVVGVGDDVFMIGLFVDHDGFTTNVPSARFGNISMMPNPKATIKQPNGYYGESFVVDMHSRTGFSGSPVYVYRTFAHDLDERTFFGRNVEVSGIRQKLGDRWSGRVDIKPTLFALLGIHWAQFPERWELKEKSTLKETRKDLIVEGGYVEGMSGVTCVIPAAHIWEVLEMPSLKEIRERTEKASMTSMGPKAETSVFQREISPAPESDNPDHKEDFTALLNVASKTKPPSDET